MIIEIQLLKLNCTHQNNFSYQLSNIKSSARRKIQPTKNVLNRQYIPNKGLLQPPPFNRGGVTPAYQSIWQILYNSRTLGPYPLGVGCIMHIDGLDSNESTCQIL